MSVEIVHRAARRTPRAPEPTSYEVERPPALSESGGGWGGLLMLVPMLGAGASMTVMMIFRGSSLAAVGALMMILTVLASIVMVFSQRGKATRARRGQREAYLAYVERTRCDLREAEDVHLAGLRLAQPHTGALASLVRDRHRLWERRRSDLDYLHVRLGSGPAHVRQFARQGDDNPIRRPDDFMNAELEHLERRFSRALDAPVDLPLAAAGAVSVVGDREFCDRVARVLVSAAATLVSPEDLHLAAAVPPSRRREWDWLTWLPHLGDQERPTPCGPRPRLARKAAELAADLAPALARRAAVASQQSHLRRPAPGIGMATLLVIADQHGDPAASVTTSVRDLNDAALGVTTLHLLARVEDEPAAISMRISQGAPGSNAALIERYERADALPTEQPVTVDSFSVAQACALARALAQVRLSPDSLEHDDAGAVQGIAAMIGIEDPANVDLDRTWTRPSQSDFLRVPIGTNDAGDPVWLDLKESAQSGMGPHGLCVGATGSGKSELLRTLVLGLLSTHSPEDVAMVLVDYKGGATFAPFAQAPHVHGVITNLDDDAVLIERIYTSLAGEVRRRQEMLRGAGNVADITAYRRRREHPDAGEDMAPMPHLLVIIDEFGELLSARPDFIELFLSIGRIGRSIGMHLLLSSQRIEAGKLRGLDTYLSYRLGLRTLSESESRTVLDTPDAFALPALPGYGYLSVDTTTYTRFRAGYVSGPMPTSQPKESMPSVAARRVPDYPDDEPRVAASTQQVPVVDSAQESPSASGQPISEVDPAADRPSILSGIMHALATRPGVGPAVWSEPLPATLSLEGTRGAGVAHTSAGLRIPCSATLAVPLGLVDDPARQWQGVWELDFMSVGNVLVVGGPRSGSTTLLRTLAASIALTHSPSDVVVYGVDALGNNLGALESLPIMAGLAGRLESERVQRVIDDVHAVLCEREEVFGQLRAESLAAARAAMPLGPSNGRKGPMLAEVVLLIDGYGPLAEEHPACAEALADLVRRGPAYGIHVVSTVSRWNEIRLNQQTFFDHTIELRLADPAESRVGRARSQTLSAAAPGRCLLPSGLFAQVAQPIIENGGGDQRGADPVTAMTSTIAAISAAAPERARAMMLLPASLSPTDIESPDTGAQVAIGMDGSTFATRSIDLDGLDRHLLLIGDPGTGRTSLLRHITSALVQHNDSDDLVIAQIDPKRAMQGEISQDYLGGYAASAPLATRLVEAVLPELERRAAGLADAAASFAPPSPRIVVVVDDYDALTASGASPLQALVPYIAMAREINLNVIVARRTNGAARGIFESAFAVLRECGATGVMFSGDRSEGQLFGSVRPRGLPVGRALLLRPGQPECLVQTVHSKAPEAKIDLGCGGHVREGA
ncbi:MAG: type VII secretion protein EccCa [Ornithinimicrobium sp.]